MPFAGSEYHQITCIMSGMYDMEDEETRTWSSSSEAQKAQTKVSFWSQMCFSCHAIMPSAWSPGAAFSTRASHRVDRAGVDVHLPQCQGLRGLETRGFATEREKRCMSFSKAGHDRILPLKLPNDRNTNMLGITYHAQGKPADLGSHTRTLKTSRSHCLESRVGVSLFQPERAETTD